MTVAPDAVLPVIGTKEFIAGLPTVLGCGPADTVVYPELAYPTYGIGALLAGARAVAADGLVSLGPERVRLVWVNSPANPTGRVLSASHLAKMAGWARERGAVLASDECYIDLGFGTRAVSVLHPDACGGSHEGLLAVHSLSKRSNLAGYRAGFVTGDPALVSQLLEIRRHAGMMVPAPVQAAMTAALDDDEHAARQQDRYAARRALLRGALEQAGWRIDHSQAGLYLWASHPGYDGWGSVAALAGAGHPGRARRVLRRGRGSPRPGGAHRHRRAGAVGRGPAGRPGRTLATRDERRGRPPPAEVAELAAW